MYDTRDSIECVTNSNADARPRICRAMQLKGYTVGEFERGAPRWKEALWIAVKCVFFQNPVPWPSGVRVALLRMLGAKIGRRVVIRSNVNVTYPWRLTIGDDVWLGEEVLILSLAPVAIESSVCISQRAFLCTGSHDFRSQGFDLVTKGITVRSGSWVAAQAFVGPGVEIGEGSMISAGSVVTENVPQRVIVRGNPAVVVKHVGG
jgi:putative colanic acid biosynthesis acetyltransferase WcaF